ncbi:MAG: alkaline phosphatase family protein [Pseudomonadota bacterium]
MGNSNSPVLMLELNELCPPIVERMMAAGELPNFTALHRKSEAYTTYTDEESLEPWVQWVTLHTGQTETVHGAKELDEGHLVSTERFWDTLAKHDFSSLIFGSMNGNTEQSGKVFLLPDPWSAGVEATDPAYKSLHDFIRHQVTEHTNPDAKPGLNDLVKFLTFLVSHGLKLSTISSIVKQLAEEKIGDRDLHWRRAIILDTLMWDVFESAYKKQRPDFATFFANSTAFIQHRYWRHMEPEAYEVKPSEAHMKSYGSAVEDSYREMDKIVGRAMKLVGPNGRIVFSTALSQEANTRYEHIGGKFVHRPKNFENLFEWLGAPAPLSFEPVMTHEAWATYDTSEEAEAAARAMENIQSNGKSIMHWKRDNNRLFFCSGLISEVEPDFEVRHGETGETIKFDKLFMPIGQVNNSKHNRNGCFWVPAGTDGPKVHDGTLPLEQATDKILSLFGLESVEHAPSLELAS